MLFAIWTLPESLPIPGLKHGKRDEDMQPIMPQSSATQNVVWAKMPVCDSINMEIESKHLETSMPI